MSTGKLPQADKLKAQRLPAPTLFLGPASRNASHTSLTPSTKDGSARPQHAARQQSPRGDRWKQVGSPKSVTDAGLLSPLRQPPQTPAQRAAEQQSNERTDALWAEMQNTLEEVELNAASGTHVFGPGHSKALDELRTAQIALAQAWAKSEAEEERETRDGKAAGPQVPDKPINTTDVLAADKFGQQPTRARSGTTGTVGSTKSQLEEETENDIQLARQRREANDRYFQRVNKGVLDVVAKLEEVAKAMKGVEMESREIWGDKDSVDSASVS